ncbi:YcfA family protein [Ferroglobus placidus DSM 10642]|uniref:YcfA family protein n=1 Tax=Ferroglobus placidus (strain DSM 10642 / AEDII12DO) TaxID=589924 RepID=D3S0C3_FERPA|nr:type II toxin-antitoxin system HicA family toxin [Ferroglobus placidus]ADC66186.1 YcfA family protein [Ferroglobus placidus DSM 10642]
MKLPRDISGLELAKLLRKFGYEITRQTGSHIRLTTRLKGEHHITIPKHRNLKPGTLNAILKDVADHLRIDKKELIRELFG